MAETKIDPHNIEALEKSLNDSATRVSTIWVSFLIFSLYLLLAAATVDDRQLLLAEPVKLPVLNIDLPLWGFFFLAPILLLIFHAYVLLQVLLLGRTAVAYNEAVDRQVAVASDNARLRQRLANTLFAQIFSGAPRERTGWLGLLLKGMAWITLAIAPVLILLVFQFMFLPYHSHFVTWVHRLSIMLELAAMFLLWPLVLDPRRDFDWARPVHGLNQHKRSFTALAYFLTWPMLSRNTRSVGAEKHQRRRAFRRLGALVFPIITLLLLFGVSLSLATFPGEWHVNLFTGQSLSSVRCERWFYSYSIGNGMRFDRLNLTGVDVVDDEKLKKIEQATTERKLQPYEGERTRSFRGRNFNCGTFTSADFRRVDLTEAQLAGASLIATELDGALLLGARLRGAMLSSAKLRGASFDGAMLLGASLDFAELQGASLSRAVLIGASLIYANLQGASLSDMGGGNTLLLSANLRSANLQGASLYNGRLLGASLDNAQLQGANIRYANLDGASLDKVMLQGADLTGSSMNNARLSSAHVWRSKGLQCAGASIVYSKSDAVIDFRSDNEAVDAVPVPATPDEVGRFIARSVEELPRTNIREDAARQMRGRLVPNPNMDDTADIAKLWKECEEAAKNNGDETMLIGRAQLFRDIICGSQSDLRNARQDGLDENDRVVLDSLSYDDRRLIADRIITSWLPEETIPSYFVSVLARTLLASDGRNCPAMKYLDGPTRDRLRATMGPAGIMPSQTSPKPSVAAAK
jgi:uncharacterized protein YjbI with pentapeptide repeats